MNKWCSGSVLFVVLFAFALLAVAEVPPKPRLQLDISNNSPDLDWWYASQKGRDARLRWWREARFGCFVHWGVYSALGGEWHGKKYGGYAEHIQRKARIPSETYRREVAAVFNPTNFNADAWVSMMKQAGMRYLVITAKHHDGFAMFDSDVSDYNIVDYTKFGRDPMAELKAACDKYGLKFGFYYSHAFDWGEKNAPGNDWEYKNPGGGKGLFGGRHWYDKHPEEVPRIRRYIDGKAIPQILELIRKYNPDIIWFDTPHKLPPEENLRILETVRKAAPNIIVNSRICQPLKNAPPYFGDYRSTGDRAVDFPARDGDWEAIPTTNESYGYSKHDKSHKKPGFLIRVIAKAAARGGNILLNIGPRGDGTVAPEDKAILKGIGDWMAVNAESIRGTQRTVLPVQAWGESTVKRCDGIDGDAEKTNTVYLHVFDWPPNGNLEVGGLRGAVLSAYLLAGHKKLEFRRLDERTISITVPKRAPDKWDSVIALRVKGLKPCDERLVSASQTNTFRAFDARTTGEGWVYGDGKAGRNCLSGWKTMEQSLVWPVYVREPATYRVFVEYQPAKPGQGFSVGLGDRQVEAQTVARGKGRFVRQDIGTVKVSAGTYKLQIKPTAVPTGSLMKIRSLQLIAPEN